MVSARREKYCKNCHGRYDLPGAYCSEDCAEEAKRKKQTSSEYRHTNLLRLLDREKIYHDPLRSLEFYRAILQFGCVYCGADLMDSTGINLDRIENGKHTAATVCGCCRTCNRLKSSGPPSPELNSPGEKDGFSFDEMAQVIGPAVAMIRARREAVKKNKL